MEQWNTGKTSRLKTLSVIGGSKTVHSLTPPAGGDRGGSPYENPCGTGFTPFNPSCRSPASHIPHLASHITAYCPLALAVALTSEDLSLHPLHPAYFLLPSFFSSFATLLMTLMTLSGFKEMESIFSWTRKAANSG